MVPNPLFQGGFAASAQAPSQAPQVLTVTQAISVINTRFKSFTVVVEGEVSSVSNRQGYAAVYFSLSDDQSSKLECLMWKNQFQALGIDLVLGQQVRVTGVMEVYAKNGKLSLKASKIELAGEGALRAQVAALAKKLESEGLFDHTRKRSIPQYPEHIAVVTSPRGDAIHDVLQTLTRRAPQIHLSVAGVQVEGRGAEGQIVEGLKAAEAVSPDLILLVRGGGSYESLMPFNDEQVVRAIAGLSVPVITGIGHEPDTTIADMVADVRASTPTAAAEISCPSKEELLGQISTYAHQLHHHLQVQMKQAAHALDYYSSRSVLMRPAETIIAQFARDVDELQRCFDSAIPRSLDKRREAIQLLHTRLCMAGPQLLMSDQHYLSSLAQRLRVQGSALLKDPQQRVCQAQDELHRFGQTGLRWYQMQVATQAARLEALSPLKVLARGFSLLYQENDQPAHLVTSVDQVSQGDQVHVRLKDGLVHAQVTEVAPQAPKTPPASKHDA